MSKASEPFCKLDWELIDCEAYRALSDKAARALVVLMRQHNGRNNGEIVAATRWLGERMGCCQRSAAEAIRELVTLGFVRVTVPGCFHAKNRPAVYALTCYPRGDAPATKDYLSVLATSPAEPKRRRPAPPPIEHQDAHEKQNAEHWDAHDRALGCSPPAYRAPGCSIPEHWDAQSIDLRSTRRSLPPAPAGGLVGSVSAGAGGASGPAAVIPSDPPSAGAEPVASIAGTSPSAQPADPSGQPPAGSGSGSKPAVERDWLLGGPNIVFFPAPPQRCDDASAVVADAG